MSWQKSSASWSTKILLIFIAATFIIWGVSSTGSMFQDSSEWAMKVGDISYSPSEWKAALDRALHISGNSADIKKVKQSVVDEMIKAAVLLQEARKLDLLVSDDMVKSEIANMPLFRNKDGKFDPDLLEKTLKTSGISEIAFIERIKEQIMRTQLVEFFYSSGSVVAPHFVSSVLKSLYSPRESLIFNISPLAIDKNDIAKPTEEDFIDFLKSHSQDFMVPERREVQYAIIDGSTKQDNISVSDDDVKHTYNSRIELYQEPERRDFEQIVFASYDEAKKAFDSISSKKEKFSDIIAQNNQKIPKKLQDVTASGFDQAITNVIFALKKDDISQPMQTPVGWHIFKVTRITESKIKNLDDVSNEIREQLYQERLFESLNKMVEEINISIASNTSWYDLLEKYKLSGKDLSLIYGQNNELINIKDLQNETMINDIFHADLQKPFILSIADNGKFILLNVKDIKESYLPDLNLIKQEVENQWWQNKINDRLLKLANEIKSIIDNDENNEIKSIAKYRDMISKGYLHVIKDDLTYLKPIGSDLPNKIVNELMDSKIGEWTNPVMEQENYFFGKVLKYGDVSSEMLQELETRFGNNIAHLYQEILFNEYVSKTSNNYKVEINKNFIN